MKHTRRWLMKLSPLLAWRGLGLSAAESELKPPFLGQGTMSGEVTEASALLQTRLTLSNALNAEGDLPGAAGVVCFEWSTHEDFRDARRTPFQPATGAHDFIVRAEISELKPGTTYHYRAVFGSTEAAAQAGPACYFKTLAGGEQDTPVRFIVGSCMNYNKFMIGKKGKASGPETATEEDKRLGFPSFDSMLKLRPDFFIGTGDIVYYDHPLRAAKTVPQLHNLTLVCGDRHWQYHSIHPSGIHEFACGALNDENARMGVAPGAKKGSDPQALIKQEYTSATPQDGFLQITAGEELAFEHFDSRGNSLHCVERH